jgi:PadR family transcriptional regulator PadR
MGGSSLDILKGTLDLLILRTLNRGPNHGYGITKWLREISGEAFQIEEGALYPSLRRLGAKGLISSAWDVTDTGREAKFYHLTARGREEMDSALANWDRYVVAMAHVLEGGGEG